MKQIYKKQTLLIAYYWPPSSGGGLMRWFKMSKYWNNEKHNLIVFTPDVENPPGFDPSLVSQVDPSLEVIKTPIWEPHQLYARFMGKKEKGVYSGFINEDQENWKSRVSVWIRSNFFIPDARMFWIKPSIRYLKKYLRENHIDVIITTGPPHSMHMIALGLKKSGLKFHWIADFRDPWTDIDYADQLRLTKWAEKLHKKKEKEVLQTADEVITVSWAWQELLSSISGKQNVRVITNGFDPEDFDMPLKEEQVAKFQICHLGSLNINRNPDFFWRAIKELITDRTDFASDLIIKMVGQVDSKIVTYVEQLGLNDHVVFEAFKPHHEGISDLYQSNILLLIVSNWKKSQGMIPGKTYEYLATGKPILGIGSPNADVGKIMADFEHSKFCEFDDIESMKAYILKIYASFKSGNELTVSKDIEKYSRKTLAYAYHYLIENL